ncbi:hypothetical protein RHS01_01198 [Rhizoctonia solani]|uniref:Uncharacterized protein n=1 Tax=Rhizoctonia solani TaxID=456999 RepID=A0A8H7IMR9_9AGAM|nr:hypothetical protein RHS01_01198 [Rhizoctonia solani]
MVDQGALRAQGPKIQPRVSSQPPGGHTQGPNPSRAQISVKAIQTCTENAKAKCWNDFINTAEAKALWNAYKWMRGQEENAGNAQIPTLRATAPNGSTTLFSTNEEKSAALYQTFFPTPPPIDVPTTRTQMKSRNSDQSPKRRSLRLYGS